jgi:hypothetical protein
MAEYRYDIRAEDEGRRLEVVYDTARDHDSATNKALRALKPYRLRTGVYADVFVNQGGSSVYVDTVSFQ